LDYLEDIEPIQSPSAEALNTTYEYIECNRRIKALRALGKYVNGYGGVRAPKLRRIFPGGICRRWIIHVKQEGYSEGDIVKLTEFLGEEVDGALITQKLRGGISPTSTFISATAALRFQVSESNAKSQRAERTILRVLRTSWPLGPRL
jgi:hypothetical protein